MILCFSVGALTPAGVSYLTVRQQESVELSPALDYDSCYAAIIHDKANEKCICPHFDNVSVARTAQSGHHSGEIFLGEYGVG